MLKRKKRARFNWAHKAGGPGSRMPETRQPLERDTPKSHPEGCSAEGCAARLLERVVRGIHPLFLEHALPEG